MKFAGILIATQATYILLTGLWPLLHIESFLAVTGPKTDIWLVKTVGALLLPVALCLYVCLRHAAYVPAIALGMGTAIAFACIDFYYALRDVIPNVYLLDGLAEIVFIAGWLVVIAQRKRNPIAAQRRRPE